MPGFPGAFLRYVNLIPLICAYLLLALLIYDIIFAFSAKRINISSELGAGGGSRSSFKKDIAVFVFAAFVIAAKAKTIFWNSFSYDDIGFLPFFDIDSSNYLSYVTGDTGFPGLPYRALLPLLAASKSLIPFRALGVMFMAGTFAAIYITASRYVRRPIAAVLAIVLISSSFFNYPVQDIRGYSFFIFFGILGLAAFDSSVKKARPAAMFTWAASFAIAAASFPLTMALAIGPAYHYFANLRKNTDAATRRLYAMHFAFLAAEFLLVTLISVRYAVYHTSDIASLADYHKDLKIFIYPVAFAVVFLVAFVYLRKDYRGALMLSASCGLAAPLIFFALNILKTCGRYYAFSLPAAAVCAAILVENLFRRREKRTGSPADRPTAFITVTVLTVVFLYCCSALLDLRKESEAAFSISVFRAEMFNAISNIDDTPIMIYPAVPQYFYYVQKKYDMDIFSQKPDTGSFFKIKANPTRYGDVLVSLGNYHTTVIPTDSPERIFDSPVYVVYFESSCSILPDSAYSKCIRFTAPEYRKCSLEMRTESGALLYCDRMKTRKKDIKINQRPIIPATKINNKRPAQRPPRGF